MNSISARSAYKDHILSRKENIFYKIDWASFIVNDISIVQLADIIGIDINTDDFNKVYDDRYLKSDPTGTWIKITFNHINISVCYQEVVYGMGVNPDEAKRFDFVNYIFDRIRVDISGEGLNYLRSINVNVEDVLRNGIADAGFNYHFTRLDFAYDLINYKSDFIKRCYALCKAYESDRGRIVIGTDSMHHMKWTHRDGAENTLYFGQGQNEKMLRVYDKKLQLENAGQYNVDNVPYLVDGELPESWIRLELQTRRDLSMDLINADNYDPETVLKYIYNKFAIRKGQGSSPVSEDWLELYDWKTISRILQNANFVELGEANKV